MLADSENVDIGLETLVDKSLIRIITSLNKNIVEMHCLVEEMGKEIVRAQSDEPGEREFLIDSKDVSNVLEDITIILYLSFYDYLYKIGDFLLIKAMISHIFRVLKML